MPAPCYSNQSGFSLIEVLVTVVILAIGLLGLAALQAKSLRLNHDSQLRSLAVNQAYAITDRMRANVEGVDGGLYDVINSTGSASGCTSGCTFTQVAQQDIFDWNTNNAAMLPSGRGTVSRAGDVFTVRIHYDQNRTGATGLNCTGDTETDLTCISIDVQM